MRPAGLQWRDYSRDLRPAEWGPTVILRGNNPQDRMSALGQKQTFRDVRLMSAILPKADTSMSAVASPKHTIKQEGALIDKLVVHLILIVTAISFYMIHST